MKAFLIARVSTADQVDALPAQAYRLTDYAESKGYDYQLFKFQESAFRGTREKFRAIIDKIYDSTEPVVIVFDKVDRFTRDSSAEETNMLKQLYLSGKVEIHFPSENLILHEHSPSTDKMRLGLNTVFAEYYSNAISDNVRRKNDQLWRDGIWTSKAPFGYRNVPKWIEVVPLQADAIRAAYEMYATGSYSIRMIRQKITDEYGMSPTTAQWSLILQSPFYTGTMVIKGKSFPHKYKTIISEELFNKAQAVREGYNKKPKRWGGLPFKYRGLMNCATCGCKITFERKKGKPYSYGHCTQSKGKHGASYVSEDLLTKQLREVFQQIQMPQEAYDEVSQALAQDDHDTAREAQTKRTLIDTEIGQYDARIERNYDMYLDGGIDKETYQRKHEEMLSKKRALEKSRKNIELMSKNNFEDVSYLLNLSRKAPDIFENAEIEEKRTMINMTLSNLELDGKELRWELKKPYDCMAFCNETRNWQPLVDVLRNSVFQ